MTSDASSTIETRAEKFFRKWAPPVVFLGVGFWAFFAGGFLAYHSWQGGFIVRIVDEHFPGMILVPMAALMALCIVLLLRWTAGALEFDLWGQAKPKGASGPLTLGSLFSGDSLRHLAPVTVAVGTHRSNKRAQQGHAADARNSGVGICWVGRRAPLMADVGHQRRLSQSVFP